jgi:hypothetical protein
LDGHHGDGDSKTNDSSNANVNDQDNNMHLYAVSSPSLVVDIHNLDKRARVQSADRDLNTKTGTRNSARA